MRPLVSILIPAYNAEPWLAETVESALAQTWPRTEVVIVDDGSRDGTWSVARRYESARVKVVRQENGGAAAARNRALAECQGDYLQWLDADDLLGADKVARQMVAVAATGEAKRRLMFSCEWGSFYYGVRRAKFCASGLWEDLSRVEWLRRKLADNLFMQTGVWLVSRELTAAAGPWDARLSYDDDGEYFARVLLASEGVRFVPGAKVFYRNGPNSLSYIGRSAKKLESFFLSIQLHIGYVRSLEDSERVRSACLKYLEVSLPYFYPERPDLVKGLEELAASLGGRLAAPRLSWKYAWIQKTFGWTPAKLAQLYYNQCKASAVRSWERVLYQIQSSRLDVPSSKSNLEL